MEATYDYKDHKLGTEVFKICNGNMIMVCIVYDKSSPKLPSLLQQLQNKKYVL